MTVEVGKYYQHRYGGIYEMKHTSLSTVDQTEWIVYQHIYPFEQKIWHRPSSEFFDGRFREISLDELDVIIENNGDRVKFQEEIARNKAATKKDK